LPIHSPSAASATADLNGKAVQVACDKILQRLKESAAEILSCDAGSVEIKNELVHVNGQSTNMTWDQLVLATYLKRVNLSEHGHYSTPGLHYDASIEKGHPFAYHVLELRSLLSRLIAFAEL
jgi:xanthine dehydrogenase large subunit